MAYRFTPSVRGLMERGAVRIMNRTTPYDPYDHPRHRNVRQSDQEMYWAELMFGVVDPALRLMVLPEDYYCPSVDPGPERPVWRTPWASYQCHAVHGHYPMATLDRANVTAVARDVRAEFNLTAIRGGLNAMGMNLAAKYRGQAMAQAYRMKMSKRRQRKKSKRNERRLRNGVECGEGEECDGDTARSGELRVEMPPSKS